MRCVLHVIPVSDESLSFSYHAGPEVSWVPLSSHPAEPPSGLLVPSAVEGAARCRTPWDSPETWGAAGPASLGATCPEPVCKKKGHCRRWNGREALPSGQVDGR